MNSSLGSLQKPTGWSWWIDDWLVVEPYPSEKKWVKVSWDDDIPNLWKVIKFMFQTTNQYTYPICSMYSIFTYIWAIYGVNDGKYSIHGAYGYTSGSLAILSLSMVRPCQVHSNSGSTFRNVGTIPTHACAWCFVEFRWAHPHCSWWSQWSPFPEFPKSETPISEIVNLHIFAMAIWPKGLKDRLPRPGPVLKMYLSICRQKCERFGLNFCSWTQVMKNNPAKIGTSGVP